VFVSFPEAAGLEVNVFLLVFIGFTVGVIAGFIGVGGGYIVTPALVVLGLSGSMAAGTGMTYIVGNSSMATLRHRELGNVDVSHVLCQTDLEVVRSEVRRCMAQGKPGGGYILSDSNTLHEGCTAEAIVEMYRYAREIGGY